MPPLDGFMAISPLTMRMCRLSLLFGQSSEGFCLYASILSSIAFVIRIARSFVILPKLDISIAVDSLITNSLSLAAM